jgi:Flp pilus assembly protein TadG
MEGEPHASVVTHRPHHCDAGPVGRDAALGGHRRLQASGQTLVIFTLALVVLMGMMAIVIDVSSYWVNTLHLQRAADAAALAGAVDLPGNPGTPTSYPAGTGVGDALAEAARNGYSVASPTCANFGVFTHANPAALEICAYQDENPNQMDVKITAPVPTYFAQIFGIKSIEATVYSEAVYQLPVPMGSPQNYYGIYCLTNVNDVGCSNSADLVPDVNPLAPASSCSTGPAAGIGQLCSKGFWGAAITQGGNQQNGDAFLPANNGGGAGFSGGANTSYSPAGYSYIIDLTNSGTGTVSIFDPTFCEMAGNGEDGHYGTGDHWIAGADNSVSTYYNLYKFVDPYNNANDGTAIATSGSLFTNENQSDYGTNNKGLYGKDTAGANDCEAGAITNKTVGGYWHNKWWTLTSGLAGGQKYRLQVTTTDVNTTSGGTTVADASVNANVNAENMFGIEVTATSGQPVVYGNGSMAAYNTLYSPSGVLAQNFYLAQILNNFGQANDKTVEIRLFDPGDVAGNAYMSVLEPSATTGDNCGGPSAATCPTGYTAATFSYWADANCNVSAHANGTTPSDSCGTEAAPITGRTYFQTALNGSSSFNNTWVNIYVPLGTSYPADPPDNGWWQIQYLVGNGNDTTTWEVNILGNPVHLITP